MSSVEVGVTHQIKIGREDAWIKVAVHLDKPLDEDLESLIDEAGEIVNRKIFGIIEKTVETVQDYCETNEENKK